ncbi:hypothetical protein [Halorussus halophilus]|uniref:hypothetical protein n=1 Tax=Halorussus halophilus TaxID=2650975 RepID=UPI0013015D1A|nr:hypothetical protein [Halorussus halophilus]
MCRVVSVLLVVLLVGVASGAVLDSTVTSVDGDDVPIVTELGAGTNPLLSDTDGDGIRDDVERVVGRSNSALNGFVGARSAYSSAIFS